MERLGKCARVFFEMNGHRKGRASLPALDRQEAANTAPCVRISQLLEARNLKGSDLGKKNCRYAPLVDRIAVNKRECRTRDPTKGETEKAVSRGNWLLLGVAQLLQALFAYKLSLVRDNVAGVTAENAAGMIFF